MRKIATGMLALVLALAGLVVASPASAALPGAGQPCPNGQFGIYTGYYNDSWPYCYDTASYLGWCVEIGAGRDNTTNSVWAPGNSHNIRLYSDHGCGGITITTLTPSLPLAWCTYTAWNGVCGRPTASSIRFW